MYLLRNRGLSGGATLVEPNLFLYLDAGETSSYSGTGTTWFDISGNGRNFTLSSSALWDPAGYMKFQNSSDMATNGTDLSISGDVTYCVLTRPKNTTSNWRTLTRSYDADHHVIIESGGWAVGIYDNNGGAFISSGYSQQSLPNYSGGFDLMTFRWTNSDNPTYALNVNDLGTVGSITNSNARYNRGFGSIGNYWGNNQPWGDIKAFVAYNRRLTNDEVNQNFEYFQKRVG